MGADLKCLKKGKYEGYLLSNFARSGDLVLTVGEGGSADHGFILRIRPVIGDR